MKSNVLKILVFFLVLLIITSNTIVFATKSGFNDVLDDKWYTEAVIFCKNKGFITGYNYNTYGTNDKITRAQFVTILYRISGAIPVTNYIFFNDVAKGAYYEEAIKWAEYNDIVTGYNSSTFGSNDPITRQDLAVILNRFAKAEEFKGNYISNFQDSQKVSGYAIKALKWANYNGIITGKDNKYIDPKANASRAEAATMIMRFYNKFFPNGSNLNNLSLSQKNAIKSARSYANFMSFSKTGLIEQLEYEGFSNGDSIFAVDNIGIDWMEQAAKTAQLYLDIMSFSRNGLIEQLRYENFSEAEIAYAINAVGY